MPDDAPRPPSGTGVGGTWIAFLVMTFAVVGLMGVFVTFAAPLPLQRALARETVLDQAEVAARRPDAAAALAALRPALADSADAVLPSGPGIEQRIARERVAMRSRFEAEAADVAVRLRWLVGLVTVMAAAFGVAVLHVSRRSPT